LVREPEPALSVAIAWQTFQDAYRRSSTVRWAVLVAVVVVGWLLFFWFVNSMPTDASQPAPAATVLPTNNL
jgi:predicted metal-binding membrane protein